LLLRIRITPQTDIKQLIRYWAKGPWAGDVTSLLESCRGGSGEIKLAVKEILPPLPSGLLYTFPEAPSLDGEVRFNGDSHWTTFNFFQQLPDDRFKEVAFLTRKIKDDYVYIENHPHYGDKVFLRNPKGDIFHSAVYLADDIFSPKNGLTPLHPWMLSRIEDLMDEFSYESTPGNERKVE
jgi:hypothetical protein